MDQQNMDMNDQIHKRIKEVRDMAQAHAQEATDPKCAVLCETTYEVLAGLEEAFDHYRAGSGKVWERNDTGTGQNATTNTGM